jgi:hypothetical protein
LTDTAYIRLVINVVKWKREAYDEPPDGLAELPQGWEVEISRDVSVRKNCAFGPLRKRISKSGHRETTTKEG